MNLQNKRQTKIIWSFESKVLNNQLVQSIIQEDCDCIRIVYQPGGAETIIEFLDALDRARLGKAIPIMIDVPLQVRASVVKDAPTVELKYGQTVSLGRAGKKADITIEARDWESVFKAGSPIYFGYGNVVLQPTKVEKDFVEGQIVQGGAVYGSMDVHVPSTRPDPLLSDFDLNDLKKVLSRHIDYFVLPGFVSVKELKEMRDFVEKVARVKPWFILKLNSKKGYDNLEALLEHTHGVLISRLELALFMEPAIIPVITKEVIQTCANAAKIVLTASEMLGSMRVNPTPTRAEVSDVANGVSDGADALVLTEDVAYGIHSARAIRLMARIVEDMEHARDVLPNWVRQDPDIKEEMDAVAYTAYKSAKRVDAKAIVCLTKEGNTAVKLSSFRTNKPIVAVTFSYEVLRKLSLVRGVTAMQLEADPVIDQVLPVVNDLLKKSNWLKPRDRIVFVSVTLSPLSQTASNLFTVQTLN